MLIMANKFIIQALHSQDEFEQFFTFRNNNARVYHLYIECTTQYFAVICIALPESDRCVKNF